ncbi:hypothetical protein [Spirosoma validum]|uniref:PLL-like beta propeller domain-containing protein n=1 Tax=Spirosoma validum TaxID=2771355 RepID=A0A927GBZ7_9BACT|nr:hypothetical protein [Spirosoma validum]MBD2752005.1 hypothetical protein [Spirosoma validum]
MEALSWSNWYRSEGCRKWMDKTTFAGTSFTSIFYQAMRLIFLDEKGNKGLLYTNAVSAASHLIVKANNGYRNGFSVEDQQVHLSAYGLFRYNNTSTSPGRLRFEGPDGDDLTKTQYAETSSGSQTIEIHFYNIIKHAREGTGAFTPSGPVPENAHGALVLAYFTGAVVLHEMMREHGFNAKDNSSLPQVAMQSVLDAAKIVFDQSTTLPLSASINGWPAYGPRWQYWQFLGGEVINDLGVVAIPGTRTVDIYAQWSDQTLYQKYWANGQWSSWMSVDPSFDMHPSSSPVVVSVNASHRAIFARKRQNLCTYYKLWNGDNWLPWTLLTGQIAGKIGVGDVSAVVIPGTKVIDVYVRGADDTLWQTFSTNAGYDNWTEWFPVDSSFKMDSSPTAVSANTGHRAIYARGKDGNVYHKAWDGSWHGWESLGGKGVVKGDVAAVIVPGTNVTDLYMQGVDGGLWQQYWDNGWSGWFAVDKEFKLVSSPAVISTDASHRSVFAKGAPGTNFVYHKFYR